MKSWPVMALSLPPWRATIFENSPGGMRAGALEHQMLEEMRQARLAGRAVGGADLVPDPVGDHRRAVVGHHHHLHAVVEREASRDGTRRRRPRPAADSAQASPAAAGGSNIGRSPCSRTAPTGPGARCRCARVITLPAAGLRAAAAAAPRPPGRARRCRASSLGAGNLRMNRKRLASSWASSGSSATMICADVGALPGPGSAPAVPLDRGSARVGRTRAVAAGRSGSRAAWPDVILRCRPRARRARAAARS